MRIDPGRIDQEVQSLVLKGLPHASIPDLQRIRDREPLVVGDLEQRATDALQRLSKTKFWPKCAVHSGGVAMRFEAPGPDIIESVCGFGMVIAVAVRSPGHGAPENVLRVGPRWQSQCEESPWISLDFGNSTVEIEGWTVEGPRGVQCERFKDCILEGLDEKKGSWVDLRNLARDEPPKQWRRVRVRLNLPNVLTIDVIKLYGSIHNFTPNLVRD
jgi:hypothetical protein